MPMAPAPYGPFPYVPSIDRPPLDWPGGAGLAVWVIVNLEFFPLDEPVPQTAGHVPDIPGWSRTDYGNRVGVFRIMEVMERLGIRGTAALNAEICEHHPRIVERVQDLGWGVIGHCQSNSRPLNTVPPDRERAVIATTLATIADATGARPTGWLGASMAETWDTLAYLAAEGITYTADWLNDDQPFLLDQERAGGGRMVALPFGGDTHDKGAFTRRGYTPADYEDMLRRTFDTLHREGAANGKVMPIALHPFVVGVPHRIGALEAALASMKGHDGVWWATGDEIVAHYLSRDGRAERRDVDIGFLSGGEVGGNAPRGAGQRPAQGSVPGIDDQIGETRGADHRYTVGR
jgi:peptidoglycan/xylan/chitin deacetylase (PgdA/CDA1 family)